MANHPPLNQKQFFKALGSYLEAHQINPDLVSTALVEDPDMQTLIAIWLAKNNTLQLQHLLIDRSKAINSLLYPADKDIALKTVAKRAKLLIQIMPQITNYDLAVKKISQQAEGWFDLNRPLFELSDADMEKLQKFALYINSGLLSANTVLDMSTQEITDFEHRVAQIIASNPTYLLPADTNTRQKPWVPFIFSDELLERLKKDIFIQEILNPISPHSIGVAAKKDLTTTAQAPNVSTETLLEPDEKKEESTISKAMNAPSESLPNTRQPVGLLRKINIEHIPAFKILIEMGKMDPMNVPDRKVTPQELEACVSFYDDFMKEQEQKKSAQSEPSNAPPPVAGVSLNTLLGLDEELQELRQSKPAQSKPSNVPVADVKKPTVRKTHKKDTQQEFIPVINNETHNVGHQRRNREAELRNKTIEKKTMTEVFKKRIPREDLDEDIKDTPKHPKSKR